MVSERVLNILKAKGAELTPEQLEQMTDRDAWKWIYTHKPPSKERAAPTPAVCFTGLIDAQKPRFSQLAESAGYQVAGSMTQAVVLLVTGISPGPVKMATARERGIPIVTAEEFAANPAARFDQIHPPAPSPVPEPEPPTMEAEITFPARQEGEPAATIEQRDAILEMAPDFPTETMSTLGRWQADALLASIRKAQNSP